MDTKQIVEMLIKAINCDKEELRRKFVAELRQLSDSAKRAADGGHDSLMTLLWLETSMTRLREIRDSVDKIECKRVMLHRVSDAAAGFSRES
jgi:hypothetical protein